MAQTLLLIWDPAIDGAFRRRFERALSELLIEHADEGAVDADPDAEPPVRLALSSPYAVVAQHNADLLVIGGPSGAADAATPPGALRLDTHDIDNFTRRWSAVADRIGLKLGRPGLGPYLQRAADPETLRAWSLDHPADPLARDAAIDLSPAVLHERLAEALARAETAERAIAASGLSESDAVNRMRRAEAAALGARVRIDEQQAEIDRLTHVAETTAFALATAPAAEQPFIIAAREHAWRARLAASEALKAAQAHPDALAWPNANAAYSGETLNRRPHGHGVMVFRASDKVVASYAGEFDAGRRAGHGIGVAGDFTWTGQWAGEAAGHGLLETGDGVRFEGEVSPDDNGAPRRKRGWTWDGEPAERPEARKAAPTVHRPATPLLVAGPRRAHDTSR